MDKIRLDTSRRVLRSENTPYNGRWLRWLLYGGIFAAIIYLLLIGGCAYSATTTQIKPIQYVNAIFMAEGGNHAKYAYGIRSVHYATIKQARRICLRTVRNNYRRYKEYGYKHYPTYLQFLASVYCPVTGSHLSISERKLNRYWVKNVNYYLQKG